VNVNLSQIWQAALGTMQMQTTRQEFDTWLKGTTLLALEGGTATVGTMNPFLKEGLENRYIAPVRRSLGDVLGFPVQVRIVIAPPGISRSEVIPTRARTLDEESIPQPAQPVIAPLPSNGRDHGHSRIESVDNGAVQLDLSSAMRTGMLNPKYTFERFIVGSSNRLAHAACLAVADHPGQHYNPLFLYGGVGLGKTHLLHAIGNAVLDQDPEINVLYVSSEKFTNDLINAIRRQQTEEFRIRYRNIDVLLIDDIQFIAGKESTQEEFFHTFNALHSAAKHIIISSDKPPKAIMTLEDRLRSRFEWGLIVDVQSPDLETRTAILRAKGEQMNVGVPDEVFDFLAHKVQSNIRELEGSLNRVAAYAELHHVPISVEVATTALADLLGSARRKRITPEMIIKAVSDFYGVEQRLLAAKGRSRNIVIPRQVAMYLLREETESSLMDIGNLLGGRDHTTVMYGCVKIADEINADSRLRNEVLTIKEKLYDHGG
jgi:chromosomal replication initiator protein